MERYMYLSLKTMEEREVKNYKILLKSSGAITQLPDSQKVFGALATKYAEANGNDKAAQMVKDVFDKESHLALSNVMPLHYFPMPQDYVIDKLAGKGKDGEDIKERRRAVKERAYVKYGDLIRLQEDLDLCDKIFPYIKQSDGQQLRASIESVIYGIEGLESKLYTVPILKLREVKRNKYGKETVGTVSDFCFYLQGNEGGWLTAMLELINEMLQSGTTLILGKRASQGLNKYRIAGVEQIELPKAECYLNLGMLLPDKINFTSSTLKLFTSERRPYVMAGGWNKNGNKYFISFIESGSIIVLRDGVEQAGKCVLSPFNKGRDIVFGNAFLYPVVWRKEGDA